jgi:hypothetical protein
VRISARKVCSAGAAIPVRRRLIKAVFFFSAESRDLLTGKMSAQGGLCVSMAVAQDAMQKMHTTLPRPGSLIHVAEIP